MKHMNTILLALQQIIYYLIPLEAVPIWSSTSFRLSFHAEHRIIGFLHHPSRPELGIDPLTHRESPRDVGQGS
jgi:hypothetical protein